MATSAINVSGSNIYPGQAVAGQAPGVVLASTSVPASAIASDGAPPKGVLTMETSGTIFLNNWTLATGSQFLVPGATYYVQDGGLIGTTATNQTAGIAISPNELAVQIAKVSFTVIQQITQITPQPAPFITLPSAPAPQFGADGQYVLDTTHKVLYGPKKSGNWGTGYAFFT